VGGLLIESNAFDKLSIQSTFLESGFVRKNPKDAKTQKQAVVFFPSSPAS
jgi:hypothetical protein